MSFVLCGAVCSWRCVTICAPVDPRIQFIINPCRGITERIPNVVLNGHPEQRYIGNLNFSFAFVEGESLLMVRIWPGLT